MQLVKIRNTHDTDPLRLVHDGLGDVTVPPGTEVIVDFSYAVVAFGHPAAHNVGVNKDRDAELAAARTYWGMYSGMNEDEWDAIMPRFEVHDMDGERIYMVLEDPTGRHAMNLPTAQDTSDASVAAQIAELTRQVEYLSKIAGAQAATDGAVPVGQANPVNPGALVNPDAALASQEIPQVDPVGAEFQGPDTPLADPLAPPAETPEIRNERRDDLPAPKSRIVTKDSPRTAKTGA